MRKLTILLALAALAASSAGCGRCRSWFHKGSPCGTMMSAPAMLSAPMAMGQPMGAPMATTVIQPNMCVEQAPMCVPCDPCMQYDPCGTTNVGSGYFGNYLPAASDCGCDPNAAGTIITPGGTMPQAGSTLPQPGL